MELFCLIPVFNHFFFRSRLPSMPPFLLLSHNEIQHHLLVTMRSFRLSEYCRRSGRSIRPKRRDNGQPGLCSAMERWKGNLTDYSIATFGWPLSAKKRQHSFVQQTLFITGSVRFDCFQEDARACGCGRWIRLDASDRIELLRLPTIQPIVGRTRKKSGRVGDSGIVVSSFLFILLSILRCPTTVAFILDLVLNFESRLWLCFISFQLWTSISKRVWLQNISHQNAHTMPLCCNSVCNYTTSLFLLILFSIIILKIFTI